MCYIIDIILNFLTSTVVNRTESFDSKDIFDAYVKSPNFLIDTLSLISNDIFFWIGPFYKMFGILKINRVFRIKELIARSNADKPTKAFMNIMKLIFFLFIYLHLVGCFLWLAIETGSGKKYYRSYSNNNYESWRGEILYDEEKVTVKPKDDYSIIFGPQPLFRDDKTWRRWTEAEDLGYKEINEKWGGREKIWVTPIDWLNYGDYELGRTSSNYPDSYSRYFVMLYYGVLNIGLNEYGPVNIREYVYLLVSLVISAILVSVVFGDIASLIFMIGIKADNRQKRLDLAN